MSINGDDGFGYEIKDGYLNIYPTLSQKTFLFEAFHFIMKTLVRKHELLSNQDLLNIHRLSRMWLELLNTGALTMISREDGMCLLLMKRHWSNDFLFHLLMSISPTKLKNDDGLIVMADHAVKAMAQIINS
jgi:hypothetical protein